MVSNMAAKQASWLKGTQFYLLVFFSPVITVLGCGSKDAQSRTLESAKHLTSPWLIAQLSRWRLLGLALFIKCLGADEGGWLFVQRLNLTLIYYLTILFGVNHVEAAPNRDASCLKTELFYEDSKVNPKESRTESHHCPRDANEEIWLLLLLFPLLILQKWHKVAFRNVFSANDILQSLCEKV